jgi:hypothetical protein
LNAGNQSGIPYSLLTVKRLGKFSWGFIILPLSSSRLLSSTVKLQWLQEGIGYWCLSRSSDIEVKLIFEIGFRLSVIISRLNVNFKFYTAGTTFELIEKLPEPHTAHYLSLLGTFSSDTSVEGLIDR